MRFPSSPSLIVFMTLLVALSGCLGGSDDGGTDTGTETGTDTGTGTGTQTTTQTSTSQTQTGSENGTAPQRSVNLSADVLTGEAPLTVTFTPTVEGGDNGTWSFDFGDGSDDSGNLSDLPASIAHEYNMSGEYVPAFRADFADGGSLAATVELNITGAPAPEGPTDLFREYTVIATAGVPYSDFCFDPVPQPAESCTPAFVKTSLDNGANGTYVVGYNVPVGEGATQLRFRATAPVDAAAPPAPLLGNTAGVPDWDMYVFDGDGNFVGSAASYATVEELFTYAGPSAGTWLIGMLYFAGGPEGSTTPADLEVTVKY